MDEEKLVMGARIIDLEEKVKRLEEMLANSHEVAEQRRQQIKLISDEATYFVIKFIRARAVINASWSSYRGSLNYGDFVLTELGLK
jgi:hypothetical protein